MTLLPFKRQPCNGSAWDSPRNVLALADHDAQMTSAWDNGLLRVLRLREVRAKLMNLGDLRGMCGRTQADEWTRLRRAVADGSDSHALEVLGQDAALEGRRIDGEAA